MSQYAPTDPQARDHAIDVAVAQVLGCVDRGEPIDAEEFCRTHSALMPELRGRLAAALIARSALRRHTERLEAERGLDVSIESSLGSLRDLMAFEDSGESPLASAVEGRRIMHPTRLGRYHVVRRLGGGGFGDVYEARRDGDERRYALKVIRRDIEADPAALARFRAEAEIAGRLRHAGIVEVLGIERHDDTDFLVMPLIDGPDAGRLAATSPPTCDDAIRIVRDASWACAHAHAAGVVHRDIKPSNIIVEHASGRAMLTDFGLAKRLAAASRWTRSDARLGTVSFMPPEQANPRAFRSARHGRPDELGRRGDVYSLGATLYHLLARRPPFPVGGLDTDAATIREIERIRPLPPSRWNSRVSAALDLVCLTCLEKDPSDRYRGASELADDLQRLLDGRPIAARSIGPGGRLARWTRRRPVHAATSVGSIAVLVLLAALWRSSAGEARRQTTLASQAEGREAAARATEIGARRDRLLEQYGADMRKVQEHWEGGDIPALSRLLERYRRWPQSAQPEAADLADPRGFEWHYWSRRLARPSAVRIDASPQGDFHRLSLSADGRRLAAVDSLGTLRAWSLDPTERVARHAADRAVAGNNGPYSQIVELAALEGDFATAELTPNGSTVLALDSTQQGRSSTLTLLDLDGEFGSSTIDLREPVSSIAIDPSGLLFATGTVDGEVRIWSREQGRPVVDLARHAKSPDGRRGIDIMHGAVTALAWSPDGLLVAAGCDDGFVAVWEVASCLVVARIGQGHDGTVTGVRFSPDGARVCSQGFGMLEARVGSFIHGQVRVWESHSGRVLATLVPHEARPSDGAFFRAARGLRMFGQLAPQFMSDGEHVVTTGDRMGLVWRVSDGALVGRLQGHHGAVLALCASADGRRVATASLDHTLRIWDMTAERSFGTIGSCRFGGESIATSDDGAHIAAVIQPWIEAATSRLTGDVYSRRTHRCVRIWRSADGVAVGNSPAHDAWEWFATASALAFNLEGNQASWAGMTASVEAGPIDDTKLREESPPRSMSVVGRSGTVVVRVRSDRPTTRGRAVDGRAPSEADEERSSVRDSGGNPIMNRSATFLEELIVGSVKVNIEEHRSTEITALAISPDDAGVALGTRDGGVLVCRGEDVELQRLASVHVDAVTSLTWSSDGTLLASGGFDRRVVLWTAEGFTIPKTLDGHSREVAGLSFSRDGRRLASAAGQPWRSSAVPGEVILWDTATGKSCLVLRGESPRAFGGVAFSPDGRRLYATANSLMMTNRSPPHGHVVEWRADAPEHEDRGGSGDVDAADPVDRSP